jgi:Kef-type K+ transport system membrane component KefB
MTDWMLQITIILIGALAAAEFARALKQSSVLGELTIGIILGSSVLAWLPESHLLEVLAEIGVIFMIFMVGLETKFEHIKKVGKEAVLVAVLGVPFPFLGGYWIGAAYGFSVPTSLFLGTVMTATSVAITAWVFMDMGKVHSSVSQTILAAAVIDDTLSLLVLTVVLATTGTGGDASVGWAVTKFVIFLFGIFPLFWWLVPKAIARLGQYGGDRTLLAFSCGLLFLFSYLAHAAGLAAIVGVFLIGMILAETKDHIEIIEQTRPIYVFLAPVFFVVTGAQVHLGLMTQVLWFTVLLTGVAMLTKWLGSLCAGAICNMSFRKGTLIGVGMIPRGEVGLIVALIGSKAGILSKEMFAAAAIMCLATTFVVPMLPKWLAGVFPREMEEIHSGVEEPVWAYQEIIEETPLGWSHSPQEVKS